MCHMSYVTLPWSVCSFADDGESEALRQAKQRLSEAQAQLEALQREHHDIVRFTSGSYDFGPDDVFFPLASRCGMWNVACDVEN